eukprot:jgi/Ulvmu1/9159/UM005_0257.1
MQAFKASSLDRSCRSMQRCLSVADARVAWARSDRQTKRRRGKILCKVASEDNSKFLTRAEELLRDDPKAMKAVERVNAAAEKVKSIQQKQAALEEQAIKQAQQKKLQAADKNAAVQRALENQSQLEAQAAENAIEAAKLQVELLECEKEAMQSELQQYQERLESGKAAVIAAAGGAVGLIPSAVATTSNSTALLLAAGGGLATCALFGVVYRYVVAASPTNPHLKGGAVAGFGLARALPLAEGSLSGGQQWTVEVLAGAALLAGQSMLMVAFAALALETASKRGALKPFGAASMPE